jgi:hypothetical protein
MAPGFSRCYSPLYPRPPTSSRAIFGPCVMLNPLSSIIALQVIETYGLTVSEQQLSPIDYMTGQVYYYGYESVDDGQAGSGGFGAR